MSLAAILPRALIAWLGRDRSYRQREPAALVLTAAADAGRGQLGVRQALLPPPRLPSIPATPNQNIPRRSRANSTITGYQVITSADGQSGHRPVIAEFDLTRTTAHDVRCW